MPQPPDSKPSNSAARAVLQEGKLLILPLGGLGEIGMNSMLIAYGRDALIVDCGVLFPDVEMHGVDLVIPDFTSIRELGVNLHAYILTHGHEDHIGALPYALPVMDAPIYASRFTSGLVQSKLSEWGIKYSLELARPRETVQLGPFEVEFLRVTHSIPDGFGLAIKTPLGTVIHTGDFKIDQRPKWGETTDLARFAEYGERGVLALLSDSTNSDREGVSASEADIAAGLEAAMANREGAIFVAAFASHIHRLVEVTQISRKLGRKVVLNGRSMINNMRIARELGVVSVADDAFVSLDEAKQLDRSALTILTTGSQAEPGSAISKLARGDNPHLRVQRGDLVIFSSRSIPGNERAISRAVNGLVRHGAEVLYANVAKVHTSGHAHKEEQRLMLNLVKPRYFVPIHGELHHLATHAATARTCGVEPENVFVIEDGQTLSLGRDEPTGEDASSDEGAPRVWAELGAKLEARKIFVDGKGVGDVSDLILRDRAQLAYAGMLICVVSIDQASADIATGPELLSRGIVDGDDKAGVLDNARAWVKKAIEEQSAEGRRDRAVLEETIRLSLRRFFRRELERKPVIFPIVMVV